MRRVSIATLMIVVLVCGVAAAALRDASDTWAGILLLLTLGLLGFSILGIRQRREAKRAFWEGFALFGWGYLTLTMGPWFAEHLGPRLPMTQFLGFLHGKLHPGAAQPIWKTARLPALPQGAAPPVSLEYGVDAVVTLRQGTIQPAQGISFVDVATPPPASYANSVIQYLAVFTAPGNLEQFQRVGQCLFTLLAALLGALASRQMYLTQRRRAGETPTS
jgi:hypothetical protein